MRNKPSCSLCGVGPTSTRTTAAPVSLPRQTSQRRESKTAARKVPLQPAHAPAYVYYSVAYIMMNTPDRVQKSYSCSQLIRYTTLLGVTKPRTCHPYTTLWRLQPIDKCSLASHGKTVYRSANATFQ